LLRHLGALRHADFHETAHSRSHLMNVCFSRYGIEERAPYRGSPVPGKEALPESD
jgi:hypothetical protein